MSDKKKGFYATLSTGTRKVVKLQAYYKKGKKWYKVGKVL